MYYALYKNITLLILLSYFLHEKVKLQVSTLSIPNLMGLVLLLWTYRTMGPY